jgi:hypothetical protein
MATQWDFEHVPNEWEPNIPTLSLPKDDRESVKDINNAPESKSDKSKRLDLFALSSEMPSSLRGGTSNAAEERPVVKPSLTMVSEYLQARSLRLRESDTSAPSKKQEDNLRSIKQTIMRTRSSKLEGIASNVCHVLDEQVIPMPSWQAESKCEFCFPSHNHHNVGKCSQYDTNPQINEIFSSVRHAQGDLHPRPVLRGCSPFRRNKVYHRFCNTGDYWSYRSPLLIKKKTLF